MTTILSVFLLGCLCYTQNPLNGSLTDYSSERLQGISESSAVAMQIPVEYCVYLYNTFTKYNSYRCHKFRQKFPDTPVPNRKIIYN
jgi:hypothetical protein